jgi:hypothetical protein
MRLGKKASKCAYPTGMASGENCGGRLDDVVTFQKGKWDSSDAGMVLYWITGATNGGLKQGSITHVKSLLSDYIARNPKI